MSTSSTEQTTVATPPAAAAESNLCQRLAKGDEPAFTELYDMYAGILYRTAYGILGCTAEAQDAVQETFVALARYRSRLTGVDSLKAYLYTILRRAAGRIGSRRTRRDQAIESLANEPVDTGDDDGGRRLRQALASLPDDQAEVVALKIGSGMTYAEIAEALSISPNTAASRYRYALDKIRADYGR